MWPFKKKLPVTNATAVETVNPPLPSDYLEKVNSCLMSMVNTYSTISTSLIFTYKQMLENPSNVLVSARGCACGKLRIRYVFPTESTTFNKEEYTADDKTLIVIYTDDGNTVHSVNLIVTKANVANVMSVIVYNPARIISTYQVNYNGIPSPQSVDIESESNEKLKHVLTALMKEDSKLADRLLGFPDTEVQEIALNNMK